MHPYLNELDEKRKSLLEQTKHLSVDQYNVMPPAFNNNIIWNMGHMLVVSESILYKNLNFLPPLHPFDSTKFRRGTKPEQSYSKEEIDLIRHALLETASSFIKIAAVDAMTTKEESTNVPFKAAVNEGTLQFLLFHEGLHHRTIKHLLQYI